MEEGLEYRLYLFVPYNISEIQKGIQAGHACQQYDKKYMGVETTTKFIDDHKTWYLMDGGTTNNSLEKPGTMQQIYRSILEFNTEFESKYDQTGILVSEFYEPDLNDALSAFCFICNEGVWNYDDYIDFKPYLVSEGIIGTSYKDYRVFSGEHKLKHDELKDRFNSHYIEWANTIGGLKNAFLRELLKGKKFA